MPLRQFLILTLMASSLIAAIAPTSRALTSIVNDDFESYANDTELYAAWEPRNGSGNAPPALIDDGILTNETLAPDKFPGLLGNGVDHIGGSVMQHTAITPETPIFPTANENIHIQSDIFIDNDGNSRMSMALRNRSVENFVELGTYNSNGQTSDPTDPNDLPGLIPITTYAYRLAVFEGFGGDLVEEPNWQFFQFDPALDTTGGVGGGGDGLVNPRDIGAGWHTYSATITPDTVTLEVDLYRDGLDNGATVTAGSDVAGVDASVTWQITTTAAGFDSFRIGSVGGLSSGNGVAFDNVSLCRSGASDADHDCDVDGADFLKLQREDPTLIAQWATDYASGSLQSMTAVPEPGSLSLALLVVLFCTQRCRQMSCT